MTEETLKGYFLIAMPSLKDPNFSQSVTLICEHGAEGAMGIVINHPIDVSFGDVMETMDITVQDTKIAQQIVLQGGPVEVNRGFVLHGSDENEIHVAGDKDMLISIAAGSGPEKFQLALGYAGWEPGQLEQEIADNVWLCGPASMDIIFNTPINQRWQAAATLLGIDINTISTDIGHA